MIISWGGSWDGKGTCVGRRDGRGDVRKRGERERREGNKGREWGKSRERAQTIPRIEVLWEELSLEGWNVHVLQFYIFCTRCYPGNLRNLVLNQALGKIQCLFLLVTNIYGCLPCSGTSLNTWRGLCHLILTPRLGIRFYYYLHFIDVETEARMLNNLLKVPLSTWL